MDRQKLALKALGELRSALRTIDKLAESETDLLTWRISESAKTRIRSASERVRDLSELIRYGAKGIAPELAAEAQAEDLPADLCCDNCGGYTSEIRARRFPSERIDPADLCDRDPLCSGASS